MQKLNKENSNKLSSNNLAILIVDVLIDGGGISKDDLEKSVDIVTNEIEARKGVGDY